MAMGLGAMINWNWGTPQQVVGNHPNLGKTLYILGSLATAGARSDEEIG